MELKTAKMLSAVIIALRGSKLDESSFVTEEVEKLMDALPLLRMKMKIQ